MKKSLWGVLVWATIAGATTALSCADERPSSERTGASSAFLSLVPNIDSAPAISDFVVYAGQTVTFGTGDHVNSGDVGVQATVPGLTNQLAVGNLTSVAGASSLIAPSVSIGTLATAGVVQTNTLVNNGGLILAQASFPTMAMPAVPAAPPSGAAGANVSVGALQIQTLNPGNYGTVNVTGTLLLNPGAYSFAQLTLANSGHLASNTGGPTSIAIAGTLTAGQSATLAPTLQTAGNLSISVAGSSASLGTGGTITALLTVPNGAVSFGDNVTATGAFAGATFTAGNNDTLVYQTGFAVPNASATPCALSLSAEFPFPPAVPIVGVGSVPAPLQFAIPASIPVSGGSIATGTAELVFSMPNAASVICNYSGIGLPTTALTFQNCSNLATAGAVVTAESFTLQWLTTVNLTLGPVVLNLALSSPPSACNDNNACTADSCAANGYCQNVVDVVCHASDQCHTVGVCVPSTGACTNPSAPNGQGCNDNNACTQSDACQSGTCVGANPVVCTASDSCHSAGTCAPATGACSNPDAPNGTACTGGSCTSGMCVTTSQLSFLNSGGTTLFSTNVPTNGTFGFAGADGELGSSIGNFADVSFTPGSFPSGQQVVVYDYGYGMGVDDEGGSDFVSDVLSGDWPCLNTHFTSVRAPAGQNIQSNLSNLQFVQQAVRYVDGTCRVSVPFLPLFHELESEVNDKINAALPGVIEVDDFQAAQPQFQSDGSTLNMGFLYEALFHVDFLSVQLATVSLDPAFSVNVRPTDGLVSIANLAQNVTTIGLDVVAPSATSTLQNTIKDLSSLEAMINSAISPQLSQLVSTLGLSGVTTSCSTPTPSEPSTECFNNVNTAIQKALSGAPSQIVTLASQILQPINFTCSSMNQCLFHPVLQAINVLPDRLEVVLAPDLRNPNNPINDPLTEFFSLVGPTSLTVNVTLGGTSVPITLDCSVPAAGSSQGAITTVFDGDSSLAQGILCGGIAQQ
jgi:hypothetical protein